MDGRLSLLRDPCYTDYVEHGLRFGGIRMANLTLAVDDQLLRQARLRALEQGTSVNALLRDYLEASLERRERGSLPSASC